MKPSDLTHQKLKSNGKSQGHDFKPGVGLQLSSQQVLEMKTVHVVNL